MNNSIEPAATDLFDTAYTFGLPVAYYTGQHTEARLAILRSQIDDSCRHIGRRSLQARVIENNYANIHGTRP